ncbi:7-cyano-7-deazaguanine synthase QueC [Nocardia transvalensis]|uniref:7-cyano-7-deazaguanine synthase QueC n=1 Tax=Nocardia transvalensis TaxID=37333 RepID=UPI001895B7E2|nr:7-cyano-7-deazaguanine synthase QueC [Nocardia transvalensis]MBF6332404.1 7-cyano-7-deazaguanine synthase QueC [Nocardia transvalensis]
MTYKPVVLLSGGMDSATALAYSLDGPDVVDALAVFIDYGQRHRIEFESSKAVAAHYGVPLTVLDLTTFGASVTSALTGDGEIPHGHYTADTMAKTVVPNRNATMLMAATGIAASHHMTEVVTAVHAGDHAIYPDCRPEFIDAISTAAQLGCGVRIGAPFVHLSKAQIARIGNRLGVPYALTWSCYEGDRAGHCGRCGTCVERAEAFAHAGVTDRTVYTDPDYWRQVTGA